MKKSKKLLFVLLMISLSGCGVKTSDSASIFISNFSHNSATSVNDESTSSEILVDFDYLNEEAFRLSSIRDISNDTGVMTYKMYSPYTDRYELKCNTASKIEVFNEQGTLMNEGNTNLYVDLTKNEIIYVRITTTANQDFHFVVTANDYRIELPYEIYSSVDINDYSTSSNNLSDPLKPAEVSYTKRDDGRGLYINSNNPEAITANEFNTSLCKQDVTNKDVFFTFEHNNANLLYYYYGYRITNKDTKDIYVTVKNLGYQVSGSGSWLGEDEWIKFYNIKFDSDTSQYNASQLANYDAYVGFCNTYKSNNRKPITYRIPSGQYMYVMGGTTKDAYNQINVFDSANKRVKGGCSNGAVLFTVSGGEAEGSFLVYTDDDAKEVNDSEYVKTSLQNGYVVTRNDVNVGSQYIGYDNCHGVVDSDLCWVFNDQTPSGELPVSYSNPYYTNQTSGTIYGTISNFIQQDYISAKAWYTHINPNHTRNAIGSDMTKYIVVDHETQQEISIDIFHYDGRGKTANIGNWMVDYIDTFTLVNQGNNSRKFTYNLGHNGVILAFVRDEKGQISSTYTPKYCTIINQSKYGEAIRDPFTYTVDVPAHSIVRFSVDYNLLANSYGCISHQAFLN